MDRNLFLKNMEEILAVAKTNGNQIAKEELLDYFSEYQLNEEARGLLIASFKEAGVRVLGAEDLEDSADEKETAQEEQGAIRFYEEELAQMDLPDEKEQKELILRWIQGEENGDLVISSLLPVVLEIARKHTGKGLLFADLVQEGNIGLLEAMAIYGGADADEFLMHAQNAVESSMLDAIAVQKGSDSVGEQMAIKANRLDEASTYLSKEFEREPSVEELAEYLSMTEEEIKDIMKVSLDAISVINTDISENPS